MPRDDAEIGRLIASLGEDIETLCDKLIDALPYDTCDTPLGRVVGRLYGTIEHLHDEWLRGDTCP